MGRGTTRIEQLGARVEKLARDLMKERASEDRTELNELIAEQLILGQWQDSSGGPGNGYKFFCALLQRAVKGPIYTRERAKALLPLLLEVNDEMDIAEWDDRLDKERQQRALDKQKRARALHPSQGPLEAGQ